MTKGNLRRRPNRATLATALSVLLLASVGLAEEDHLFGFTVKDVDKIAPGGAYTLGGDNSGTGKYATQATGCELKKAKFLFVQADKNGGDDIHGGPPGDFICYKAKCASSSSQPLIAAEDQFGFHTLTPKKPKLVCAPFVDSSMPRFVDNGDGTVTDRQTRLTWEKKTTAVGSGVNLADPHDVDNKYSWGTDEKPDGEAFVDFLYALNGGTSANGVATSGCFAGHCDWRLPTIEELQTILLAPYPCGTDPCIDAAFGSTQSSWYWSASSLALDPALAWFVQFGNGNVSYDYKELDVVYVRVVRGGS